MSQHNISYADTVLQGSAYYASHAKDYEGKKGVPVSLPLYLNLGAVDVADTDALIKAATGGELPDTDTTTYTFATQGGASPLDGVITDGIIGSLTNNMGRNVTATVTHDTAVVAMTIVVTGTDIYGDVISETLAITAGGTSKSANGKKAFYSITTIALTAAADSADNTVNMGFGDVIGLPYRIADKNEVLVMFDGNTDDATVLAADDNTATATTGDVRGTIDPAGTLDGAKTLSVVFLNINRTGSKETVWGIDNYAG